MGRLTTKQADRFGPLAASTPNQFSHERMVGLLMRASALLEEEDGSEFWHACLGDLLESFVPEEVEA